MLSFQINIYVLLQALRYPYYSDILNVVARRKSKNSGVPSGYRNERWYEDLWRENEKFSFEVRELSSK